MTVRVYVSVGSNIEREANVRSAVAALNASFAPLILSNVYENKAQGFVGNDFYNMVIGFDTDLSHENVREALRNIERERGRRWGSEKLQSRTLDLDVLLYGDVVERTPPWDIPRREIEHYAFVLCPLSEIAGDYCHPETGKTIARMWSEFNAGDQSLIAVPLDFTSELGGEVSRHY